MVEDYLTDRDQEEALKNWWRENWKWIFAGVALGLALLAGYQYWQSYRTQRAHAAAKIYSELQKALESNDLDQAGRLLKDLSEDHAMSAYTQQGRLLLAKHGVDAGRFEDAIKQLRQVVDESKDKELASVARLRLGRLLIQTGKHDEALQLLDVKKAGAFAAPMREIRGDALVAKGDTQGARAEYAAALAEETEGQVDRAAIELKLRDVGGEVPSTPVKAAEKGDS